MNTTSPPCTIPPAWLAGSLVACLITCLAGGCASAPDGPRVVDPGFSYLRQPDQQAQTEAMEQGQPGWPSDEDSTPGHQARQAVTDKPVI